MPAHRTTHLAAHLLSHLGTGCPAFVRSKLAVLVGIAHFEVLEVSSAEFLSADRLIIVGIGHLHHLHPAAVAFAMRAAAHHRAAHAHAAHAVVALTVTAFVAARMRSIEFRSRNRTVLVGIKLGEVFIAHGDFVGGAVRLIDPAILVDVHPGEHFSRMGLRLGAGYGAIAIGVGAVMVGCISYSANRQGSKRETKSKFLHYEFSTT